MKTRLLLLGFILKSVLIVSQNSIEVILKSIEDNNSTLKALKETADAQMLENKTGIYLSNPEVEFGYLWGNPHLIGNRVDFSAMQSIDIATITGIKNRLADKKNISVEWLYKSERMNILLEAKKLCFDLIYYNSIINEFNARLNHANYIYEIYEKRLSEGDANRLELNKAHLSLKIVLGELLRMETERNAIISNLKQLNGGEEILLNNEYFEPILLPTNFEEWYRQAEQNNPILLFVRQEVEVSKDLLKLTKVQRLPSFSVGFISEKVVGEKFQGVKVGISLPLWENKNQVAHAEAAVKAAESRRIDNIQNYYFKVKNQYSIAIGLNEVALNYRNLLVTSNSAELLKKALDTGEISLLNYLTELSLYYDIVKLALQSELDYQKAVAELLAVEL